MITVFVAPLTDIVDVSLVGLLLGEGTNEQLELTRIVKRR
jgi:hypothetical protein